MNSAINLKKKRVLITGGLGFIGSNIVRRCLDLGAEVTIYDCLEPNSGGNMYNIHDIKKDVRLVLHDILNFDQISQYVLGQDIIINCAASTSHSFSMMEPWFNNDVNVKGVINLLEAIKRFNPGVKLIHLGTTTQLGPLKYAPADENHPEFPRDIYSANKTASEKYVLIYASAYNLNTTVVRLSNIFGPRASIHSPSFTFNNFFIGLALQNKDINIFGDGAQKRNVIFVDDAVDVIISMIACPNSAGQTYFAVGDKHYSVTEIAHKTMEILGKGQVNLVEWPKDRKVIEVGDAIISNNKIKEATNWEPKHTLEDGLVRTKEYYSSCLEKYLR